MKIRNGFVVKSVGDSNYVVATGELTQTFRSMIRLNGSGRIIWDMLTEGADIDGIVSAITDKYDVRAEDARRDVEAFVKVLVDNKIVED